MASANTSNLDKMLTTLFPDRAANSGYKRSGFLQMVRKDTKFFGDDKKTVVNYSPTSGGGSTFATAQGNKGPSKQVRFTIQHKLEYQLFSVAGPLLRRAKGKGAIVEVYRHEMQQSLYAFWRTMAAGIWGGGGGALGRVGSSSGKTITLKTKADISHFEVGMYVQLSSDDGTQTSPAGLRDSDAQGQITKVDHQSDTAILTFGSNVSTIWPNIANDDYIFRASDYGNKFSGLQGWNPITAPTSGDSFNGVDRTVAVSRLSGYRVDGAGQVKEETLMDAAAEAKFQGFSPTTVFANPLDIKGMFKTQQGYRIVDYGDKNAKVGFKAVELATPAGDMMVVSETDCPKGYAWMLDPSNYILRSAGELPTVLDEDGPSKLREHNADAYEHRLGCDLQLDCDNPGECVIITW